MVDQALWFGLEKTSKPPAMTRYGDSEDDTANIKSQLIHCLDRIYYNPQREPDFGKEKMELQTVIASWKSGYNEGEVGCPIALAYLLDHKYTDASLQLRQLKGNDQLRLQYLQEVCGWNSFTVFLASLERIICGECCEQYEGDDWREFKAVNAESLRLTVVVDLEGAIILRNIPIDECSIVQDEPFAGDPDKENWSGPTGNEGMSATHYYYRTVRFSESEVNVFAEC